MAIALQNNIIRAKEDFVINLSYGDHIQIYKDQEFTIRNIFSISYIENPPILFNLKEFPHHVILPIESLEKFDNALDLNVDKYFDHSKENFSNRIKKYNKI